MLAASTRDRLGGILVTLLLFAGCNADDAEDDGKETVGALTDGEVSSLCEELRPYMLRASNGACTSDGLDAAETGEDCETVRAACFADNVGACSVEEIKSRNAPSCNALAVSDLRDCIMQLATVSEGQYGKDVDCSTGLRAGTSPVVVPQSCERMIAACPDDLSPIVPDERETPDDGERPTTCDIGPAVGGCAGPDLFGNDSCVLLSDQVSPSNVDATCTYLKAERVEDCPTDGVIAKCITACAASAQTTYSWYAGDVATMKSACDSKGGIWLPQ